MGPKGSNRAPGGTAPGGSRFGRPEDGSISALGKPDLRGSTIMPPLRNLRQERRWISSYCMDCPCRIVEQGGKGLIMTRKSTLDGPSRPPAENEEQEYAQNPFTGERPVYFGFCKAPQVYKIEISATCYMQGI